VLSGDVHHAYVARVQFEAPTDTEVYQLTCSPLHNHVPAAIRVAFRAAWSRAAERCVRLILGRVTAVPPASFSWTRSAGPSFGNQIATLRTQGRRAHLTIERSVDGPGTRLFETVADLSLTGETQSPEIPPAHANVRPSG
jgi:hypothetical protein